jgi:hypothetical protein
MPLKKLAAVCSALATLWVVRCEAETRYVAAYGNDSSTSCLANAPCFTLAGAHNRATPGDTIICLTSPYPVALSITKSVTIDCSSARAAVQTSFISVGSESTRNAIVISIAPSAGDPLRTVRLRGITIDGGFPVTQNVSKVYDRGIDIRDATTAVYIEDCVITNIAQQGIYDHRIGGQTKLFVKDTVVSNSSGPGIVATSSAPGVMVLDNVSMLNNLYGAAAAVGNNISITRSVLSGNAQAGVVADGGAQITIDGSLISNNNIGMLVGGTLRLLDTKIQFNNQAVSGPAISLGRNTFSGNSAIGNVPVLASGASGDVYN